MKNFNILFTDVKNFMNNEVNRAFTFILLINIVMCAYLGYEIRQTRNFVNGEFNKLNKKIDFRYFNMTRSIEEIHNIKIDTQNGEIKKRY